MLSTMIMFGIIQGLYILREDEEAEIEKKKERELRDGSGKTTRQNKAKSRPRFEEVPKQRTRQSKERAQNKEFARVTYFFVILFYRPDGISCIFYRGEGAPRCEQSVQSETGCVCREGRAGRYRGPQRQCPGDDGRCGGWDGDEKLSLWFRFRSRSRIQRQRSGDDRSGIGREF